MGDIVNLADEVVGLQIERSKERPIVFWHSNREIEFDVVIDNEGFLIDEAHFVLKEPNGVVLCRVCRDEIHGQVLGADWHSHRGAHGPHEPHPEWNDWNFDDVLNYLKTYED